IKNQVRVLQQMFPLIFVDSHEMGGDQSFYFSPEAEPYNPLVTGAQRESLDWLGQNNAKWFDQLGYDYFTREIFDAMYPGYGASWPLYYGGIATTYEMGSARGHNYRRTDGSILTYADGVQRNFIAYMSTLETASKRAKDLLQRFYSYRQTSLT
ncbi:peptidase M14, partial [Alishewanella sp. SMS9]|nr:peptidase M14 [Alishewanella sp. SMS9]